jgi:hypothetical protein
LVQTVLYPYVIGKGFNQKDLKTMMYKVHQLIDELGLDVTFNNFYETYYRPMYKEIEKEKK